MARPASPRLVEKRSSPINNHGGEPENDHRPGREDSAQEAVPCYNWPRNSANVSKACRRKSGIFTLAVIRCATSGSWTERAAGFPTKTVNPAERDASGVDARFGLKPHGYLRLTPAECVAERTWSTLGLAKQLRARFGEETLTDLLVLDMLPHPGTSSNSRHRTRRSEK